MVKTSHDWTSQDIFFYLLALWQTFQKCYFTTRNIMFSLIDDGAIQNSTGAGYQVNTYIAKMSVLMHITMDQ